MVGILSAKTAFSAEFAWFLDHATSISRAARKWHEAARSSRLDFFFLMVWGPCRHQSIDGCIDVEVFAILLSPWDRKFFRRFLTPAFEI